MSKSVEQILKEALESGKTTEEITKLVTGHYNRRWHKKTVEENRAEVRALLFKEVNKKLNKTQQEQMMYDCLEANKDSFKNWLQRNHPELLDGNR